MEKTIIQGDWEFNKVNDNPPTYYKFRNIKTGDFYPPNWKTFDYYPCRNCKKLVSNCGFAINHKCKEVSGNSSHN